MSRLTLVLGGARSGKSRFAEGLAMKYPARTYIATAEAFDDEMRERIARHRADRGGGWTTVEAPLELTAAFRACGGGVVLIDCLTVWIGNLMHHGRDVLAEAEALGQTLREGPCEVIVVSNEVGLSIVPDNALAREFRDLQGLINQKIAALADDVTFIAAGLPLTLKKSMPAP